MSERTFEFTARGVAAIPKPAVGQLDYFDTKTTGFGVRASYGGKRSWFAMYRANGKRRRVTIGDADKMALAKARKKAQAIMGQVAEDLDPAGLRAARRKALTVQQLADQYVEQHAKKHKKSWKVDRSILGRDVIPEIGTMKAIDVRRSDIKKLVDKVTERGAPTRANRVHEIVRRMFNFAVDEEIVEVNPAVRIPRNKETRRDRVLTSDEIRSLWDAMNAESKANAAVLKLMLLTAQREGEILSMRWDDIDGEWWTIPAELSKNGLSHRVPLSAQALDVVNDLRTDVEVEPQKCAWVFAKRRGDGHATRGLVAKPLSSWTERAKLTDFRLHDLRRTAASHMTSMGISRLTVSKILNHVETGVTAVYDRHSYDAEKRQALNVWGARVTAIVSGALDDNVVDLAMQNRSAAS